MLESFPPGKGPGRYSIFAFDPIRTISADSRDRWVEKLRDLCGLGRFDRPEEHVPIRAGWIGHISYEAGYFLESALGQSADSNAPLSRWSLYDTFLIHDARNEIWTVVATDLPRDITLGTRLLALQRIEQFERLLEMDAPSDSDFKIQNPESQTLSCWNYSREVYLRKCRRVLQYIRDGDVYQVNLARRYRQPMLQPPIALYEQLSQTNPAAYAAYLQTTDGAIISSSPELFLELKDGTVVTRPIKGTRPRRHDSLADETARRDLAASPKDRAELDMIIDLERNDLGRVCETGSIEVVSRGEIEVLPSVFHRTATIRGKLCPSAGAFDLIRATFPGGSITGAPKIRAMQIIRELEPDPRGVYCGAIGYISLNGDMQLNLPIRTMTVAENVADFYVGSGIVADSDPEQELAELDAKAAAMLAALQLETRNLELETQRG